MAMVNPSPAKTAGRKNEQSSGESATFTGIRRRFASRDTARFTEASEVAAKAISTPSR
jgi:hypothetical protein